MRTAHLFAVAVILLAGALSTVWAFVVPIFQAPDEPAHFDYAISIYSAGRLIRAADGPTDWIVSPYTRYLMRVTDFKRITGHSSMRVPRDYGSRAYFSRVDANAPTLQQSSVANGRINYIVPFYPFGFYALEATWMKAVSLFTTSLVALFFSARLLCVFLTMLGLYFNYRTAINLGLPPWLSVGLVAAVGFFPLTTFVSSYVQPDNLAYMLVSLTLYLATSFRQRGFRPATVVALGFSLGLLSITKYQFFLSAAIPAFCLAAAQIWRKRPGSLHAIGLIVALLAPSIVLLSVQHWVVAVPFRVIQQGTHSDTIFDYFRGVLAGGTASMVAYALRLTSQAFVNFFIVGPCAATYWQVVGWGDTPIVIVNGQIEFALRAAISFITVAVIAVLSVGYFRNALRIGALIFRKRVLQGMELITRDPVLNSYSCFIAIMFVLYIVTNNAFAAEGRQWYPYVFAGFLCLVWYAPRTLKRSPRALPAVLVTTLVCYALVSSLYALGDVRFRYYGPESTERFSALPLASQILNRRAIGILWPVETAEYNVAWHTRFSFPTGAFLKVSGAAIFPKQGVAAPAVAVVVDSHVPMPSISRQYEFDIAEETRNITYGYSGFLAFIKTSGLDEGPHSVKAYALVPDGRRYEEVAPRRLFFLTSKSERFSLPLLRALEEAPVARGHITSITSCSGRSQLTSGALSVAEGSRVLVTGLVRIRSADSAKSDVWLLADGKPYPAVYSDAREGKFYGTLPAHALTAGVHRISAFVTLDTYPRNFGIGQPVSFIVERGDRGLLGSPSSTTGSLRCEDSQRRLDDDS